MNYRFTIIPTLIMAVLWAAPALADNAGCLECHDNSDAMLGFLHDKGEVQCTACHGDSSEHQQRPRTPPTVTVPVSTATMMAPVFTGSRWPTVMPMWPVTVATASIRNAMPYWSRISKWRSVYPVIKTYRLSSTCRHTTRSRKGRRSAPIATPATAAQPTRRWPKRL